MKVAVFGTGYVGLVQAAVLAEVGHEVVCVDIDAEKIERLKAGEVAIYEPDLEGLVRRGLRDGRLHFTTDAAHGIGFGSIIFIAVGTPPDEDGSADLQYVLAVARSIGTHLSESRIVVVKSTVPVGTGDRVRQTIAAALAEQGRRIEVPVVSNPEWTLDIDKYYAGDSNPNYGETIEAAARPINVTWRISELKGFDVTTPTGQELGELRDIAVDTNGRVSYATLSVGGFLGIGDRVVAVPWDSLNFSVGGTNGDERKITLAVTKKQLELAPEFKAGKEHCAEMCDPKWVQRVYTHYSSPAYWNRTGTLDTPVKSKN